MLSAGMVRYLEAKAKSGLSTCSAGRRALEDLRARRLSTFYPSGIYEDGLRLARGSICLERAGRQSNTSHLPSAAMADRSGTLSRRKHPTVSKLRLRSAVSAIGAFFGSVWDTSVVRLVDGRSARAHAQHHGRCHYYIFQYLTGHLQ